MTQLNWKIPNYILNDTAQALASKNLEVFILWMAPKKPIKNEYEISRLIIPKQDSHITKCGAYVHIDGRELSRIGFMNFYNKERTIIQLHTHPSSNVEMSLLDKKWEIVKHIGALSIIVPNFGKNGLNDLSKINIYEKEKEGWRLWNDYEFQWRFTII